MKRFLVTMFMVIVLASISVAAFSADSKAKAKMLEEGYALNSKYCTSCHDSVADPEKSGMTRDTWFLVINIMHKYGMEGLSEDDKATLVDYFYTIRKGIEKSAG
ncbi:c-type cytochrome [Limisalsivibrio acetivorans]|uniref:c-type cytochrome n=1 Tax=Limisalsivibrio acetivorans TaxID=1304888 RepID=UPI0003B5BD11|nr:cytochrome c [Limisalsivibrio acetivorans]